MGAAEFFRLFSRAMRRSLLKLPSGIELERGIWYH
jgi:hypothetical protein